MACRRLEAARLSNKHNLTSLVYKLKKTCLAFCFASNRSLCFLPLCLSVSLSNYYDLVWFQEFWFFSFMSRFLRSQSLFTHFVSSFANFLKPYF
uniref:Zinc finger CCCH domain-containing protein 32 n=1 Tax=Rhizophora mucronata TaxID=61149 RepID=A0A2P2IID6_RHIMU